MLFQDWTTGDRPLVKMYSRQCLGSHSLRVELDTCARLRLSFRSRPECSVSILQQRWLLILYARCQSKQTNKKPQNDSGVLTAPFRKRIYCSTTYLNFISSISFVYEIIYSDITLFTIKWSQENRTLVFTGSSLIIWTKEPQTYSLNIYWTFLTLSHLSSSLAFKVPIIFPFR